MHTGRQAARVWTTAKRETRRWGGGRALCGGYSPPLIHPRGPLLPFHTSNTPDGESVPEARWQPDLPGPEPCADDFSTVLMIAARKQDLPMVRMLLEHGADANKSDQHEFLLESGVLKDKPKKTPLSVALEIGNAAIIELLKSKGANA